MRKWTAYLLGLLLCLSLTACAGGETPETYQPDSGVTAADAANAANGSDVEDAASVPDGDGAEDAAIPEDGVYTSKDDVALYLHTYGHLPGNFLTKREAQDLGWTGGSLEPFAPGMCIGGSRFGNYESLLPEGHRYQECDIDTLGQDSRGAKRLVYSDDGLIYYTDDHYQSFTLLYGEEETP